MATTASVPTIKLNSGYSMPLLGLGTSGLSESKATEATNSALSMGYSVRHSDCCAVVAVKHVQKSPVRLTLGNTGLKRGRMSSRGAFELAGGVLLPDGRIPVTNAR